jgi:hypothetical protein
MSKVFIKLSHITGISQCNIKQRFLCFFNNVIVKVIFLIVIAFVALYCPAIGLMMAILLVSIIQMCQRKQLSMDIDRIKNNHSQMKNKQPDMKIFESLESNPPIDVDQPDYYENEKDGNEPDGTENFENIQGESENEYDNSGFEPQGVDKMFSSCISQCGNGSNDSVDSSRELNGMCGKIIDISKVDEVEIISNCYFFRPIIFNYKNNYLDVHHG